MTKTKLASVLQYGSSYSISKYPHSKAAASLISSQELFIFYVFLFSPQWIVQMGIRAHTFQTVSPWRHSLCCTLMYTWRVMEKVMWRIKSRAWERSVCFRKFQKIVKHRLHWFHHQKGRFSRCKTIQQALHLKHTEDLKLASLFLIYHCCPLDCGPFLGVFKTNVRAETHQLLHHLTVP